MGCLLYKIAENNQLLLKSSIKIEYIAILEAAKQAI